MKSTTKQQPIQKTYEFVWEQANKASNQWFVLMSRNNYAQAYLYYRKGELGVFEDKAPEGWTLGSGERLGAGLTRQQVASKINTIAQRLPFLPTTSEQSRIEEVSRKMIDGWNAVRGLV